MGKRKITSLIEEAKEKIKKRKHTERIKKKSPVFSEIPKKTRESIKETIETTEESPHSLQEARLKIKEILGNMENLEKSGGITHASDEWSRLTVSSDVNNLLEKMPAEYRGDKFMIKKIDNILKVYTRIFEKFKLDKKITKKINVSTAKDKWGEIKKKYEKCEKHEEYGECEEISQEEREENMKKFLEFLGFLDIEDMYGLIVLCEKKIKKILETINETGKRKSSSSQRLKSYRGRKRGR